MHDTQIIVSEGAKDHQVARAVAHEIAEIRRLKELGAKDNQEYDDALAPGSKATKLSPHDEGRIAELAVVAKQLRRGVDGVSDGELRQDMDDLIRHLGLDDHEAGPERMKLIRKHLGEDHRPEVAVGPGQGPGFQVEAAVLQPLARRGGASRLVVVPVHGTDWLAQALEAHGYVPPAHAGVENAGLGR